MIVDSINGEEARLEDADGRLYTVPAGWLPAGTAEGAVIAVRVDRGEESVRLELRSDTGAQRHRREAVRDKLDRLRGGEAG